MLRRRADDVRSSSDPATRVRAESRSREASSRDSGARDPLGKAPFTSARDRASRTADQSGTDAVWERG